MNEPSDEARRDEARRGDGANSRLKRNQRLSGSFHWSHKNRERETESQRETDRETLWKVGKGATTLKFHIKHNQEMMRNYINEFQLNADSEPGQKTRSLSLSLSVSLWLCGALSISPIHIQISVIVVPLDNYRFRWQHYNAL